MGDMVERVARAFYERVFEEKWADLHPDGVERALYLDAARAAIAVYEEEISVALGEKNEARRLLPKAACPSS